MQSPAELNTEVERNASPSSTIRRFSRDKKWRAAFIALVFIAIVSVVGGLIFGLFSKSKSHRTAATYAPNTDPGRIRLKGTTEADRMHAIAVPLLEGERSGTLTLTKLAGSGTRVKPGDVLAEFDRQAQLRLALDKQAEYEKLANQLVEEKAKEDAARAKDETEIRQAESALSKAELELQRIELMSRIDAEKAQEALDEARATLQQLRETFDLKRQAAKAGIRLTEIQADRARQVMQHAQANAELMKIKSPIDGVVVLNNTWKQEKMAEVQQGDQLRSGVSFMQVVDPSLMQVRASVNQEDFFKLQVGQTARVHLDAYPELEFSGKLEEIAPIATPGTFSSKLRTFAAIFSVAGSDPRLMPDLSAAIDMDRTVQADSTAAFH
jgi:HlyD family secretion protein